jgi:AGCS family alanine or glycine:cation symporter
VIALLGRYAFRALSDYRTKRKRGEDPTFRARDIGITDELDYWR